MPESEASLRATPRAHGRDSIGKDAKKSYVVINNILDGGNYDSDKKAPITRSHNLYVGLTNFQSDRYGWKPGEKELVDEKADPANPPAGGGTDVRSYFPKDIFPEIDFDKLANVTTPPGLGASVTRSNK